MGTNRRRLRLVSAVFAVFALLWGVWAWWTDQRYRSTIMGIELEMANGRFGIAARELTRLLEREPTADEAAILLGRCEQERGRLKAAAAALARVTPGSELSHKAILAQMRLLHDQGEFAGAEKLITEAALDPRNDSAHVRVLLVPIFSQLGRLDEAQHLLEQWWERLNQIGEGASERAIDQVRMHIELALKPNPVENVREYLDQASRMAADDDRVWLGRANLAIRTGQYDESRRLLDDCITRRPDDIAVWSSRLALGMAANRSDLVEQALTHLPADALSEPQIDRLNAWLCAHRGDRGSERKELERLVAASPGDLRAIDRLTQLEDAAGQHKEAHDLHARQAEIERLKARYQQLFDRNQPLRDAEEMADLAIRLGRPFEAKGFLTVEIAQDPARDDLRQKLRALGDAPRPPAQPGKMLADVVGPGAGPAAAVDAVPAH
jgi:enediyne biosynthesis protein E4